MHVFNTVHVLNLRSSKCWVAEWLGGINSTSRAEDREFKSTPYRMCFIFFFLVNDYNLLKIELMQSMILFVFRVFFIYHILPFSAN